MPFLPDAIIYHLANEAGYEGDAFDGIIAIKRFLNKYYHSPSIPRSSPQAPSLPTGKLPSLLLHHITTLMLFVSSIFDISIEQTHPVPIAEQVVPEPTMVMTEPSEAVPTSGMFLSLCPAVMSVLDTIRSLLSSVHAM